MRSCTLVVLAVLATLLASCGWQKPKISRPNIIYILADDLGYGDIGAYGQKMIRTPNIDRLAKEGMLFTRHYAGSTVCAPSRASLLTGRHTGNSQIRGNHELGGFRDDEERGQYPLEMGSETLATMLKTAGYRTAVVGKWGLGGPGSTGEPNEQGFDYFFGFLDQKQAHNHYPTHLWRNRDWVPLDNDFFIPHPEVFGGSTTPDDYKDYIGSDYAPDRITAEAKQYIRDNVNRPFFLYLAFTIPHAALQVPDTETARYMHWNEIPTGANGYTPHPRPRAARAAMISHMDDDVGEILGLLRELQIDKRTLIIFSSDNGPSSEGGADIEFFDSASGLRGRKRDLYEGGIRVPMIARWPSRIPPNSRTDHVSAFWDVMPTLAELSGSALPDTDGVSFLPVLLDIELANSQMKILYWEFAGYRHERRVASQSVMIGSWKAVRPNALSDSPNLIELYDLDDDPTESRNIAANHPDIIARAASIMNRRSTSSVAEWNFPAIEEPPLSNGAIQQGATAVQR